MEDLPYGSFKIKRAGLEKSFEHCLPIGYTALAGAAGVSGWSECYRSIADGFRERRP